jgi:O-antigen/teichoic acid export membrane protein
MARIASGTVGGQLVTYLAYPIILIVYSPEQFGQFASTMAVATPLAIAFSLRLEMAVPLPREAASARALVQAGMLIALAFGTIGSIAMFVLWSASGQPEMLSWLGPAPLLASLLAATQLLTAAAVREARFSAIGVRALTLSLATVCLQLVLGAAGLVASGLVLGLAIGNILACIGLARSSPLLRTGSRPSLRDMRTALREHRGLSATLTPAGVLNALTLWGPVLVISATFGPAEAGRFSLAQRLLALPVSVIGQAVGQVYISRAADIVRNRRGSIHELFFQTTWRLAPVALLGAAAAVLMAPSVVRVLFGQEWETTGTLVQALSIATACQLVVSPTSQTLIVTGVPLQQLIFDVLRFSSSIGGLLLAVALGASLSAAVWCYSGLLAASYIVLWEMSRLRAARHDRHP